MSNTIREEISALVRAHIDGEMQYLTNPDATYEDTDNLCDKLGLDELDFLEIVMHLEEQLAIEVPDQDFATVNDFVDAVEHLSNFGSMTKRAVVDDGVLKCYLGHSCGHTQIQILSEHGLIRPRRNASHHSYDRILTPKGRAYLKAILKNASFSGLMNAITKKD